MESKTYVAFDHAVVTLPQFLENSVLDLGMNKQMNILSETQDQEIHLCEIPLVSNFC